MEKQTAQTQKQKEFFYKVGWIIALMLIAFILGVIFKSKLAGAVAWPLNKSDTCAFFNKTADCESYWCLNFMENTTWDSANQICILHFNITIERNMTQNISCNTTNITDAINITSLNSSYNFSELETFFKNYTDTNMKALRDSLVNRIENNTVPAYSSSSSNNSQQWPWYVIPLTALIIIAGLAFLYTQQQKTKEHAKPKQFPRNFNNDINLFKGKVSGSGMDTIQDEKTEAKQDEKTEDQKNKEFVEKMKKAREEARLKRQQQEEGEEEEE